MRTKLVFCSLMFLIMTACKESPSSPAAKTDVPPVPKIVVEREKAGKEKPLPPEVKIRLKRDGKESYSWELSGTDVDQILKVDEKLRKQLGRTER